MKIYQVTEEDLLTLVEHLAILNDAIDNEEDNLKKRKYIISRHGIELACEILGIGETIKDELESLNESKQSLNQ